MADFWDTFKKFITGELKVGTGANTTTLKPTLNPFEAVTNLQKVYEAVKRPSTQSKPTAQSQAKAKTSGFTAPTITNNLVIDNIAKMTAPKPKKLEPFNLRPFEFKTQMDEAIKKVPAVKPKPAVKTYNRNKVLDEITLKTDKPLLDPQETMAKRIRFGLATDDELKIYSNLTGEARSSYLKDLEKTLEQRQVQNEVKSINNTENKAIKNIKTTALAYGAGIADFGTGTRQALKGIGGDTSIEKAPTLSQAYEEVAHTLRGGAKIASDIAYTGGQITPAVLAGAATAGFGAAPAVASIPGAALTGISSGGNTFAGAKEQGYSDDQARAYGWINGALESGLQYALGGVKGTSFGGASKLLEQTGIAKNLASKLAGSPAVVQKIASLSAKGGDEFTEEWLQAVIDPVVRNATLGENNKFEPFSADKLYQGALGAIMGAGTNIPSAVAGPAPYSAKQNVTQTTPGVSTITDPNATQIETPALNAKAGKETMDAIKQEDVKPAETAPAGALNVPKQTIEPIIENEGQITQAAETPTETLRAPSAVINERPKQTQQQNAEMLIPSDYGENRLYNEIEIKNLIKSGKNPEITNQIKSIFDERENLRRAAQQHWDTIYGNKTTATQAEKNAATQELQKIRQKNNILADRQIRLQWKLTGYEPKQQKIKAYDAKNEFDFNDEYASPDPDVQHEQIVATPALDSVVGKETMDAIKSQAEIKTGEWVYATDKGNIGQVIGKEGNTYIVNFRNPETGAEAAAALDASQLRKMDETYIPAQDEAIPETDGSFITEQQADNEVPPPVPEMQEPPPGMTDDNLLDTEPALPENVSHETPPPAGSTPRESTQDIIDRLLDDLKGSAPEITTKGVNYNKELSRNLDAAAGDDQALRLKLRDILETPFWNAKSAFAHAVQIKLDNFFAEMQKHGIQKGSRESAGVYWYGSGEKLVTRTVEKNGKTLNHYETIPYTLSDLQTDFPNTWKNIVAADKVNRDLYDAYVDEINRSLEFIYPNALESAKIRAARLKAAVDNLKKTIAEGESEISKITYESDRNQARKKLDKIKFAVKGLETQYNNLVRDIETGDVLVGKRLMKRKNYYRHFLEIEQGFRGLFNLLTSDQEIDPLLVGVSDYTKPKTKWESFLQRRKEGTGYVEDAVAAMTRYIPAAEYKVHIDPFISYMRSAISTLQQASKQTRNTNKLIEWLTDWTNDLAGKTNPFDRAMQKFLDRKFMKGLEWLNDRVKANAVIFNLNSAVAQWLNLPNGIAYIKNPADLMNGVRNYLRFMTGDGQMKKLIGKSGFLTERYLDSHVRQFDEGIIKSGDKLAMWLLEAGDKQTAQMIWFAAYNQAVRTKVKNPIAYADDITRRSIGGRGIGEIPLTLKSRIVKLLAPFQIEVNNRWQFIKEMFHKKDALGLILLYASTWMINTLIELLTGRRPLPDMIQATVDAVNELGDTNKTEAEKAALISGRLVGMSIKEMPFAQYIGSALPEAQRTALFGENDPSRFGTGMIGLNILTDLLGTLFTGGKVDVTNALLKILPPKGGSQMVRTKTALEDLGILPRMTESLNGAEITQNSVPGSFTASGGLRFPIGTDPLNAISALLFGSYATREGQNYLKNNGKPLSEKQTANVVNAAGTQPQDYINFLNQTKGIKGDKDSTGKTITSGPGSAKAKKIDLIEGNTNLNDDQKYQIYYNEIFTPNQQGAAARATDAGVSAGDMLNMYKQIDGVQPVKNAKGEAVVNSAAVQKKQIIDSVVTDPDQRDILYDMYDIGQDVRTGEANQDTINKKLEADKLRQTIPETPMIKAAQSIMVDTNKLTADTLDKLAGMQMNPQDYYYINDRQAAIDTVDKIDWYTSMGLNETATLNALKNWDMTAEQKANMALAGDMGINENAFLQIYADTRGTMQGTKSELNQQLITYLDGLNLSGEQKTFLYETLKFSQKQYKSGNPQDESGGRSGGGRKGLPSIMPGAKANIPTLNLPNAKRISYSQPDTQLKNILDSIRNVVTQGQSDIRNAAMQQELQQIDDNIFLSATAKAARKRDIQQRYERG